MSNYISKEELRKEIEKCHITSGVTNQGVWNECVDSILRTIDYIPSSDVRENVYGEWIPKERKTECSVDIDIVCSECGYVGIKEYAHGYELNELSVQEIKDFMKKFDMNFCPNCGADMRGTEMATLEIDKKYIDEAVQIAIDEIKQNFIPLSVIEDIKQEIKRNIIDEPALNGTNEGMACYNGGLLTTLEIIDKHIADMRGE